MISTWISAARPRTLPASAAPVIVATALAMFLGVFKWQPALLCLIFALLAQIASNMANDYFDYLSGADAPDRVGPRRAVVSGDVSPKAMRNATFGVLLAACAVGCGLIYYGGWWLVPIGIVIAICAILYSAGPYPLAYHGLGDVAVFIFFGLVAVNLTFYVQAQEFNEFVILSSCSIGLAAVNILIINNYRDKEEDEAANKRTTVVIFGRKAMSIVYLLNGILACLLLLPLLLFVPPYGYLSPLIYLILHIITWNKLRHLSGAALNPLLGGTARNLLILALTFSIALCIDAWCYGNISIL